MTAIITVCHHKLPWLEVITKGLQLLSVVILGLCSSNAMMGEGGSSGDWKGVGKERERKEERRRRRRDREAGGEIGRKGTRVRGRESG